MVSQFIRRPEVMADWSIHKFGELVAIRNAKISTYDAEVAAFCLELEHIETGTGRLLGCSDARDRKSIKYHFRKGDVLFGRLRPYLRKYWFAVREGVCSTEVWPLTPKNDDLIEGYLAQVVKTDAFIEAASSSYGTHMPRSDWKVVAEYETYLPPKEEQIAIAEALSDADELIEGLEALIAKKRAIKQGAMQDLLSGRRRLPGFSGDWVVTSLGDIAHIKTGSRNNQDKIEGGEYPFFVRSECVERINSFSYDCEAILVPGEGGIGSIFHYINGKFDAHQRVYVISQFSTGVSGRFVHLYMTQYFGSHAMQNTVKATVDSLRLPTFQNFSVNLPPTADEQQAIARVLSDIGDELMALEARLDKARQIKQGMMQDLLTGRVRLV